MSIQPPPIQLDGHKEKSSSVWQCIIKSNCCSSTNGDDEHQDASIDVEVSNTETKTCCVAKEKLCCTIQ